MDFKNGIESEKKHLDMQKLKACKLDLDNCPGLPKFNSLPLTLSS